MNTPEPGTKEHLTAIKAKLMEAYLMLGAEISTQDVLPTFHLENAKNDVHSALISVKEALTLVYEEPGPDLHEDGPLPGAMYLEEVSE